MCPERRQEGPPRAPAPKWMASASSEKAREGLGAPAFPGVFPDGWASSRGPAGRRPLPAHAGRPARPLAPRTHLLAPGPRRRPRPCRTRAFRPRPPGTASRPRLGKGLRRSASTRPGSTETRPDPAGPTERRAWRARQALPGTWLTSLPSDSGSSACPPRMRGRAAVKRGGELNWGNLGHLAPRALLLENTSPMLTVWSLAVSLERECSVQTVP